MGSENQSIPKLKPFHDSVFVLLRDWEVLESYEALSLVAALICGMEILAAHEAIGEAFVRAMETVFRRRRAIVDEALVRYDPNVSMVLEHLARQKEKNRSSAEGAIHELYW